VVTTVYPIDQNFRVFDFLAYSEFRRTVLEGG